MMEFRVSIDVECAAVGKGHFDTRPCRIAMVDYDGNVLFDEICNVPGMQDPLTEFTGLTTKEIELGRPLKNVLAELHKMLIGFQSKFGGGVMVVGQAPQNDIVWTKLEKLKHYNKVVDLGEMFKTGKYYYSLRRVAYALLGRNMNDNFHDPTEDAKVSMKLYREYRGGGVKMQRAKNKLKRMGIKREFPDFRVKTKYNICSGMYNPANCVCGQPSARGIKEVDALRKLKEECIMKKNQEIKEAELKQQELEEEESSVIHIMPEVELKEQEDIKEAVSKEEQQDQDGILTQLMENLINATKLIDHCVTM